MARHRVLQGAGERSRLTPIAVEADDAGSVTAAIGGPGQGVPPLLRPELRGDGGLSVRMATAFFGGSVQARLGTSWSAGDAHPLSFDGSTISAPFGAGRLYASVERRHWGPAWAGSLILDGGARAVPAIGWRKADDTAFRWPLLSWLGPWNVDVFAGQLSQRQGPSRARLLGARLQVMPLPGLELAASRTEQWGGSGRPETWRSLFDALVGHDNVDPSQSDANEPGNGLAGFDGRYTLDLGGRRTVSVYGQGIGEDEAGGWPSHYLATFGIDAAFAIEAATVRVFAERADTAINGAFGRPTLGAAYRHHIYTDGYTQQGDPLGHPAGGDVRLTSVGAIADAGTWTGALMLHRGFAYPTAQLYPGGGRLRGGDLAMAWPIGSDARVGLGLTRWIDPVASRTRARLWWQRSLR